MFIERSSDLAGVAVTQRHQTEYMDAKPRLAGSELSARSSTGECSIRASSDDHIIASTFSLALSDFLAPVNQPVTGSKTVRFA